MTDGKREADEDNPEGYWEWEGVKRLPGDLGILKQARGKAVKIVSALLPALPRQHRYKIVYMTRPISQVVESQWKMLERQGKTPPADKQGIGEALAKHSERIRKLFEGKERVRWLEVSYPDLVRDPGFAVGEIAKFLGESFAVGPAVFSCIRPELHREKGEEEK